MIGPLVGAILFYTVGYVLMFIVLGLFIIAGIPLAYVPFRRQQNHFDFMKSVVEE